MTLTQLFTAIANAIRTKKGTSESIVAEDFPTEIANIPTGIDTSDATAAPGDLAKNKTAYVNEQKITGSLENKSTTTLAGSVTTSSTAVTFSQNYINPGYYYPAGSSVRVKANNSTLATNIGLTAEKIKKDETILGVTGTYEGSSEYNAKVINPFTQTTANAVLNNLIQELPLLDMSNVTSINSFFKDCINLTTISLTNTGNITSMQLSFQGCTSLLQFPEIDTSSVISMKDMCNGCANLNDVPILNTSNMNNRTSFTNTFAGCNNLTNTSLNNILQMCINATYYNTTSYVKTLANLGLTSAQATICQGLSNYQAFLNAGWTTGY